MADNKPLYDLYKGLQAANCRVPDDYESFERTLTEAGKNGAASRHTLYETLRDGYYDVPGRYEDFYNTLFEPVNGTTSRAKDSYDGAAAQTSKAAAQTKVQGAASAQTKVQGAASAAPAKAQGQKGTAMTDAERRQMFAGAGNIVAQARSSARQAQNRMDYAKANTGLRTPRVSIGDKGSGVKLGQNNKVAAKAAQYDPASGKAVQTYVTESGSEYADRNMADVEQNGIDQYKDSMSVNGQLREAYAERDRLDEALRKRAKEIDDQPGQLFNDFMRAAAAASSPAGHAGMMDAAGAKYDADAEYNQLMAAARKNRQTIQLLEDKKNNEMNSFWHSLATTAANGYTFTDGTGEMRDAVALQLASRHIDSINRKRAEGKPLTKEEETAETVLRNFATDDMMRGLYAGGYGAWARAGGTAATSIDFAKDILLNPGASAMAKGVMRGSAKAMAKGLAKLTGEKATQLWKNAVVRRTLKATGMLIGAHTAGAYVSNTTGIGRTMAAMGTLTSGNVGVDENGNYKVENAMGLLPAFLEAERQQTRENGSEMFGEFIPGVGGMVKKGLEKIGLSKLTGAMTNIGNKEWYKQYSRLLQAGGYNGLPGEALEEYEGSLFDALTGHAGDAWDDMTNLQNHVDIWLGCATMGALLGAVPMMMQGHHTAQYYRYKHGTDKADKVASWRMTAERWEPLREKIDGTDNGNMANVVADIVADRDLHVEEKKAALNYVRNLTMMRGYNIAEVNNAGEGEAQSPEVRSVNDSYSNGYETTDAQAMNDVKTVLDMKRAQLAEALGVENADDVDAVVGDDPLRYIDGQKKSVNTEGMQAVVDYANAKSAFDGMVQRIEDDADGLAAQRREEAEMMRHADGEIRPVAMKETDDEGHHKMMYLVDGEVTMTDDGSMVDKAKSDRSVVVYDPETGKRQMIDPASDLGILALGNAMSAADYDATIETERERYVQQQMDEALGRVRLAPGEQIVLPGGEAAVVMAVDGDNITVSLGDGKQTTVQLSELQRIRDEKALADYRQRQGTGQEQGEGQTQGAGQEAAAEEAPGITDAPAQAGEARKGVTEGAPAEFVPDMELTVRDVDGSEKPAMVMGRVRYENGSFVPDANGSIVEYYMDGEVKHDHEDRLRDKVVGHVAAEPMESGNGADVRPQYGVNDTFTLRDAEGNAVSGEVQGISEDGVEIRTDAPLNGKYVQVIPAGEFEGMVESVSDADGNAVWQRGHAENAQTDEEKVIREGIRNVGEGLSAAVREQAAGVRETDINNWLQRPGVAEVMRKYGEGAQSVEEMVQRALADNPSEEAKAALNDIMRFDSSRQIAGQYVGKPAEESEAGHVRLSDEIDENGRQFVLTSDGKLAFGEIGEEAGLPAAPILLSEGMITNPVTNDGYGLVHIEARHGDQIRKAGYKSVVDFIETVAKNYDVIKEGNLRDRRQTYRLQLTDKHNNTLMVELSGDGTYWNINTAGIFKTSYGKKNKEVYNRHTTAKQPVEAAETSQDAEHGDTQASSSMNVPTSSGGKVMNNHRDLQGNVGKTLAAGQYDKDAIPMDKSGEPLYERVPKERTVEDLFGKLGDGGLAREFASQKVAEAEKRQKSLAGKAPKMGTKVNEYLRKKAEHESALQAAQQGVDYWRGVKEDIERLTHTTAEELEAQKRELDGSAAREAMIESREADVPESGVALAAQVLADSKVTPESLKAEAGYGAADLRGFVGMQAKAGNGGLSIAQVAENVVEMDDAYYNGRFFGGDSQEARDAVLEALSMARTRGELRALARPNEGKAIREYEDERDRAFYERYGMGYEEYLDYAEQEMVHMLGNLSNFDEEKYLQEHAVEITNQIDKEHGKGIDGDVSAGEEPVHGAGGEVLPGERADESGRGGALAGHGEGETEVRGGHHKDEAVSEETSGGVTPSTETEERRSGAQANVEKSAENGGIDWSTREEAPRNETEWMDMMRFEYDGKPVPEEKDMRSMKRFVDNVLSGDRGIDETTSEYTATTERSAEISATGLYNREKAWFSHKKYGDAITFFDEGEKALYSLTALRDKRGSIARVILTMGTFAKGGETPLSEKIATASADVNTEPTEVREQKTADSTPVSHNERVLRDALDVRLREGGMDVIGDAEEGQRVLDMANGGDVRLSAKKRRALETAEQSQKTTIATAVSSADGAKVLNNLDTLANNLEKTSSHRKTFIGDIAKAFGADSRGRSSKYATFETKNGEVVTIRVSDHNAKVSNFDAVGEDNGISIVVTRKPNKGVTNDGYAHVVEFFYPEIALQRAEGKPLAEIVKSIKQALYSGEFKDTTGLAEVQEVNADDVARLQKVYQVVGSDHIRFFRTKGGEAYGFTAGGKIYYDPRIATSETLVHEYAHLWASALRAGNAEEWKNVVGLMKGTSVWEDVKKRYPELKTDDEIADEVLAQYSGKRGAEKLRAEAKKIAEGNDGVFEKAEAISALERVKRALAEFWKGVCDMLHIHFTSAEEVAGRVMKDLLDGVDPRKFGKADGLRLQENDEIADIVSKAKADGTYMKAPNGEPSKLSPRQWAQVRTKAFKEWFGDWEKATRIEKLRKSEPVEITGKEIEVADDFRQNKKNALAFGKGLQGSYTNADTGNTIQLQRGRKNGGLNEVLQHNYKDVEHIQSIAAIPQIIEKSIYIDSEENRDTAKNQNVSEYQHYVCGLKIGGEDYTVLSAIAVDKDGNRYYDHNLTRIEKGKLLDQINGQAVEGESFGTTPGTNPTTLDGYKGRKLVSILQTNASKVVDENGEPRVVYHQTNSTVWVNRETGETFDDLDWNERSYWQTEASEEEWENNWEEQDFYTFDNKTHGRTSIEMPAFFFSPKYDEYHEYGDRTIEAYLNIKNPAINPAIENAGVYDDAGKKAMQKLIEQGYDGFIREYDGTIEEINAFYPNQIKSATENVGMFDANNDDIRYQFAGERGAEAADRAEEVTTRLDNQGVAREMEEAKKDAKAIKLATGWERGADGKWRYEIPDIEYVSTGDADLNHRIEMQPWGKEYVALTDRMFDGETLTDAEMKRFEELSEKAKEVADLYKGLDKKSLADYVRADDLFKAYPELRAVNVEFVNRDATEGGAYSDATNTIYVNENSAVPYEEVIAHEVQHAIQHIEGFARGGSEVSVEQDFKAAKAEWKARAYAHELKETAKELGGEYNQAQVEKALIKEYEDMGMQEYLPDNETRIKGFNYFARGYADRSLDDAIKRFRLETSTRGDFNAYNEYRKLSGEVEARNVQKRMGMTEEERRASLAAETEDVSREDQIFLFGDRGESHMGSRTDKRMAEIGKHFEGKALSSEEQSVVDVYSGKKDRQTVDITNDEGYTIHLEMQQGNEPNAGTRHSIFRHVGKNNGSISYNEIGLIPDVIKTGERTDKGANVVYQKKIDGVRYTVYTDKKGNKEIFHDFYSNRKTAESESFSGKSTNTQSSARTSDNAVTSAKVARKPETGSGAGENVAENDAASYRTSEAKRMEAERLGQKFNTRLNIIEDTNAIVHDNPTVQARRRKAKGWYDTRTGEVTIVLANNMNVEDVAATVFHETVGHKGLRELIGEEGYSDFLREVYEHAKVDVRRRIAKLAAKHNWDFDKATDEYLSKLAEKGFEDFDREERSMWQWLKEKVMKAIDKFLNTLKLPKWVKLGDNELRYMLWRSKERLERGKENIIDMARDIVKREELGLSEGDLYREDNWKADEVLDMASRNNIRGASISHFVETAEDVEAIRKYIGEELYGMIMKEFHDKATSAIYLPSRDLVVVFTNKAANAEDAECSWLHEQTHSVWHKAFTPEERERYGAAVLDYLRKNDSELYNHIINEYDSDKHKSEACSYLIEKVVRENGSDKFMNADFTGLEEIAKFAKAIQTVLRNGKRKKAGNQPQRVEADGETLQDVQNDSAERGSREAEIFRQVSRKGNETEDIWRDGSMGLHERITAAATRLANNHRDNKTFRNDAMRAIGGNLTDLRKAMSLQRQFDITTVKRVADLARVLMNGGYLNNLSQQEVKRLLAAVKNSTGHNDIEGDVQKVVDIMVDNQLKNAEAALHALESIKGTKVDARGVEVQGQLDADGAHTMKVFKKARGWERTAIEDAMSDAQQRMGSADTAVAEEAALDYAGLHLALDYVENITGSKTEEDNLRKEMKQAHDDADERERDLDAYREYIDMTKEAIRQNRIDRALAYYDLVGRISGGLRESMANARVFKEAEKERVREIQHNANSDMEGRRSDEHYKPKAMDKFVNNSFVQLAFAPLGTFEQMMRLFGSRSANGEGYLYNRFMRGWVDARQKEIRGVRSKYATLDAKAHELFGGKVKTWADLIRKAGSLPKATVRFWNGGEMQERELSQGNLMYIYMVNKMLDGRMKLRKMGISENDVADIEKVLDPKLLELADWLQDEFLVETRNEYNETHKRMFGASMAAIENYFPLKILANARADKAEDLDNPEKGDGISTSTGSIIKRRRNALALDITGADALHVTVAHVAQMEHWNAFAELNRDLNTLRTYKRFRNKVQNMTTIYGSGTELWKKFNDLCQMMSGTYRPSRAKFDEAAVNFAKGVTAAKVSFRLFTALKQFLSMPAYIPEARADYLLADIVNPVKAWKWSIENLPIFEERVKSRAAGDPRLMKTDMDWEVWRSRVMELASRIGMAPNAFVDAVTVAIGAHSMYRTKLNGYLRDGYTREAAEHKAKQDAEILYNLTQQSSEGAFMSTMQVDRSWLSVLFSVFRNSSMAYQRQLHDAMRNLKRNLTPGQRGVSVDFMKKQMMRDGLAESVAEAAAQRRFRGQFVKDVLRVATFGYIMQFAWNLGSYLPYLLFGDDDETKDGFWQDVWAHTAFGWTEGFTGGDVLSQAGGMLLSGEGNPAYASKDMPLTSDIMNVLQKLGNGKKAEALTDIVNIAVQSGIGVNPQSITDAVIGIMDACGDDPELAHEAVICVGRILQVPQSQLDKLYFDDVNLSGDEASKYTPVQLAERYARYKVKRGRLYAPWTWNDEKQTDKNVDKANTLIGERAEGMGDKEVNEAYLRYEEVYKGVAEKVKAANKAAETDYVKAAEMWTAIEKDAKTYDTYEVFRDADGELGDIVKCYMGAKTEQEASLCLKAMLAYKGKMVAALNSVGTKKERAALNEMNAVADDFYRKYDAVNAVRNGKQPNR